ncbi:sensor histidine kinase [Sphingomonas bacterium]|uniref:sensor histidine kinase n=1 Tax=Sphingomonas bacterium TaxID=1895847 RepID=UPI00157527B0|nr:sensor histidine kinase [Sphingomonas bacterium]
MARSIGERLTVAEGGLGRALIVFLSLGFISLLAAILAAGLVITRIQEHTNWVNHTYEVGAAIDRASLAIEQGETARRGYVLTGADQYRVSYNGFAAAVQPALRRLAVLISDNPVQRRNIATLTARVAAIVKVRDADIALVAAGRHEEAIAAFNAETGKKRLLGIRDVAGAMRDQERALLAIRDADQRRSVRSFYIVLAISAVLLAVVAVTSVMVILRYAHDLTASRDRLRALSDTLEDQVADRTADLSRANDEIQRFAYIVSHDLRSPLVNVMGFTAELASATGALGELVDRAEQQLPAILTEEARLAAREDLPEAIGFIRTSTQKMDRLINAILKLSREGRRTIAPEPLDLAAIADTAVAAMRHIVDDRGAAVAIERPMAALVSDRLAVEQILSNLIENATKYLQPGRPGQIVVSAQAVRGRVVVAVKDNGRGIDPRDHQRVFDLFRRSGQQDQPGEGIGLAHVRALAYRLGGTIDVQSALGEGATFRLNLPAAYQPPQGPDVQEPAS